MSTRMFAGRGCRVVGTLEEWWPLPLGVRVTDKEVIPQTGAHG